MIPQTLGGAPDNIWNRLFFSVVPDRFWEQHVELRKLVALVKPKRILEIGVCHGDGAICMIREARKHNEDVEYYGVDCFEDGFSHESNPKVEITKMGKVEKRLSKLEIPIHLFRGDSTKVLPKIIPTLPPMDFIYIDGGHSYKTCKSDWENSRKLMHEGSVVVFGDYNCYDGVTKVVDEIKESGDYKLQFFDQNLVMVASGKGYYTCFCQPFWEKCRARGLELLIFFLGSASFSSPRVHPRSGEGVWLRRFIE
jgi:hypothetical protein